MLRANLAQWLAEEPGLKVHSVTLRLKDKESVARKLARPDRSYSQLWELTDLVGLRVIGVKKGFKKCSTNEGSMAPRAFAQ
jgi:ppGpp synthetase/RelA/SpoT-type nucleotidyltranferase